MHTNTQTYIFLHRSGTQMPCNESKPHFQSLLQILLWSWIGRTELKAFANSLLSSSLEESVHSTWVVHPGIRDARSFLKSQIVNVWTFVPWSSFIAFLSYPTGNDFVHFFLASKTSMNAFYRFGIKLITLCSMDSHRDMPPGTQRFNKYENSFFIASLFLSVMFQSCCKLLLFHVAHRHVDVLFSSLSWVQLWSRRKIQTHS